MDNNRTVSVLDHCQTIKNDYQVKSTSTLQPTLSLRNTLETGPVKIKKCDINRLEWMIKRQQKQWEKRAKKRSKKLREININLDIPLTVPDANARKTTKYAPQRLPLNENQDDDLEIVYRSIQSIGDIEDFQPPYVSSRIYTTTPVTMKTESIQTGLDREPDKYQNWIKPRVKHRKRKRNVFHRHTYTKCRQPLLKHFYYGVKLSNHHDVIEKNHNLCNAIVAYCLTKIKPPKLWNQDDLDLILINGERFYELGQKRPQLPQYCRLRDDCGKIRKRCYFFMAAKPKVCGFLTTQNRRIYNLTKGLQIFFGNTKKRRYGILQVNHFYNFLIWKTRDFYYYFDTFTLENYVMLANFYNLKAIVTVILKNKQIYIDNNLDEETKFKIYPIRMVQIIDDNTDPADEDDGYHVIDDKKATITGLYDLNHPIFGIARNRQALITVIIALIYSKVIQTNCWLRDTINQILIYGNHLFLQLRKQIETITIDTLPDQIPIGSYSISITIKRFCLIEDPEQLGVRLSEFFFKNTSCILEITTDKGCFTLGIWRQRDFFYLFDPYLCNKEGYHMSIKDGGGACCTITPILATIFDLIRYNYDFIGFNYRIYTFIIKQMINQSKSSKTIEQQLLELDKVMPKHRLIRQRSCVDLDDENMFGRYVIERPEEEVISEHEILYGEGAEQEPEVPCPESYEPLVAKVSKSTEIDTDFISARLGVQKTELPEAKCSTKPKPSMVFSTKTINDYYPEEQMNVDYLLPFVYLVAGVLAKYYNINNWTPEILDNCLQYGVELFKLFNLRYDQLANFMIKTIKIEDINYQVRVDFLIELRMEFNNLKQVLKSYFNKFNCFILITPNYCCFIYTFQQEYYLFDSINNKYCLFRFNNNLDALVMKIINNKNRVELFKQLPQYNNCVISACIVEQVVENIVIDNRQQLEQMNRSVCLNYYVCLCANLLLLTTLDVLTNSNYRYINEIIRKGKLLYTNDNQRNLYTKKLIKNLLINNYYFDLIIKLIVFKKSVDFNQNFQLVMRDHSFILLQYGRNFYSIFIDKTTDLFYLFDPMRINNTTYNDNDRLKWLKFESFQQLLEYLDQNNNTTNQPVDKNSYHFFQFEIISFIKRKGGEKSR